MRRTDVVVARLLRSHGTTFAEDAGIELSDAPAPLWQLLVLSLLLSTRIGSGVAVRTARELFRSGWGTPAAMRASTRGARVAALGRGGYRRYDERTASRLDELAHRVREEYADDLRRLPHGSAADLEPAVQRFTGIGPVGAAIFCREAQGIWPVLSPYLDARALAGAARLGLPDSPAELAALVGAADLPRLAACCVRAAGSSRVVEDVLRD